jgi:hypothetical protein
MEIDSLKQPCVIMIFNLQSMQYLAHIGDMELDPLTNADGWPHDKTTDASLAHGNGPHGDLESIGELTTMWLRTVETSPPLREDFVSLGTNGVGVTLYYDTLSEADQAYACMSDLAQNGSFRFKNAMRSKNVRIAIGHRQMF